MILRKSSFLFFSLLLVFACLYWQFNTTENEIDNVQKPLDKEITSSGIISEPQKNTNSNTTKNNDPDNKSFQDGQAKIIRDLVDSYASGEVAANLIVDKLMLNPDSYRYESLWLYFIGKLKADDFHYILTHVTTKVNHSVGATLVRKMTSLAIEKEMDVNNVIDSIPEGLMRRYALEQLLRSSGKNILKWSKIIVANENIDHGHLWDDTWSEGVGLDACNSGDLSLLYGLFVGPGKQQAKAILIDRASKISGSLAEVGKFMAEEGYDDTVKSIIYDMRVKEMKVDELSAISLDKYPSGEAPNIARQAAKIIADKRTPHEAVDWLLTQPREYTGMAFNAVVVNWLKLSPEEATKQISDIADNEYRDRGFLLIADYLNRPEEKEIRLRWINAIHDSDLKNQTLKKYGY